MRKVWTAKHPFPGAHIHHVRRATFLEPLIDKVFSHGHYDTQEDEAGHLTLHSAQPAILMSMAHMKKDQIANPRKRGDRFGLKLFLIMIVATAAVFAWTSSQYRQHDQEKDTWVDERGKLHVLGITLGESNLRQAEIALQSRSDVALYIYPVEHSKAGMKLEAFFPAIADRTQVILLLDAAPGLLKEMQARATMPHIYPNAVARSNLAPPDQLLAQQLQVRELTLLPSIAISPLELTARFGAPGTVTHPSAEKTLYAYPAIGLEAMLSPDEPAQLHFSTPAAASSHM